MEAIVWNPEVFVALPGTSGQFYTTRSTLGLCPKGHVVRWLVVREIVHQNLTGDTTERVSCLCPICLPDRGNRVVLG